MDQFSFILLQFYANVHVDISTQPKSKNDIAIYKISRYINVAEYPLACSVDVFVIIYAAEKPKR